MKTVIMAGGKGTRIQSIAADIPKPMIPIDGIPILEREIYSLRTQGFRELIITISYMGEQIVNYFGDGTSFGVDIKYFSEEKPLGNAGALFKIRDMLGEEPFLLLNGDAVFDVNFNRMIAFHKSKGGLVTLFTHPNSHPYDSGLIIAGEDKAVTAWLAKEEERPRYYKNRVNAGLHVIDPIVLDLAGIDAKSVGSINKKTGKAVKVDLDRQLLKPLASTGKMFCYDSTEYVKDMGTPERFAQVESDIRKGLVNDRNLSNLQKAIFLDRDGTINVYKGFLRNVEEFELCPGVADAIRHMNASGYLVIVVTNQPVIARGELSLGELETIHNKLETELGYEGAYIDGLFFCPHHPHKGYVGEVPELKCDCDCRKPKPGMLLQAGEDFHIDLQKSYMVGDSESDIKAGKAAGCKTVLIGTDDFGQNITVKCLKEFTDLYLI